MTLCLDIGGTKIRSAIVNGKSITNKEVQYTKKKKSEILKQISEIITKNHRQKNVCIGLAGFIKDNKIIKTPHLPLSRFNLKSYLEKKHKVFVKIENDAHCAAIAEKHFNFRKYKNLIFLTLGTGIGGAIFINNKIYVGKGFAGEFGHISTEKGEFEKIASGKAAKKIATEIGLNKIKGSEIKTLAEKRDKKAMEVIDKIAENLSCGIRNLVYSFDPEIVVIGGGFGEVNQIYKKLRKNLKNKDLLHRNLKVKKAEFGDDAGLIGAALLLGAHF